MEWVLLTRLAVLVVDVPVDAVRLVVQAGLERRVALDPVDHVGGKVVALVHPGAVGQGADELLLAVLRHVLQGIDLLAGKKAKNTD